MNEIIINARAAALVHIDLNPEIKGWRSAVYGRQVRAAQISALEKTQEQMNGAIDYISGKGEEIDQLAKEAKDILNRANTVNDSSEEYMKLAQSWAEGGTGIREGENTNNSKYWSDQSKRYADNSSNSAMLSQSWTEGGTGVREGENTNNAKFWSGQSQNEADRARNEADRAAQYAQIIAPNFFLDVEDGWLYQKGGAGVEFAVGEDGALYWKIVA